MRELRISAGSDELAANSSELFCSIRKTNNFSWTNKRALNYKLEF